jgi:hypothetical protein
VLAAVREPNSEDRLTRPYQRSAIPSKAKLSRPDSMSVKADLVLSNLAKEALADHPDAIREALACKPAPAREES